MHDEIDVTNLDNASEHYGLGYAAERVTGGGIAVFFEQQLREHKEAVKAEMRRQGVTDPQKLIPLNAGAYDDVEVRIRTYQAQGIPLIDAVRAARSEAPQEREPTTSDLSCEYLGDTVENLMKHQVERGASQSKGKKRETARVGADTQRMYDQMLGEAS